MKLVKSTLLVLALCCFQGIAFGQCEDDTTPPVITVPDDITIDCDDDWPAIPAVTCWDDCDEALIPTFIFWYVDNKCGFQSQILLWSVTDQAGNSTSATQIVMKCDLSPPVFDFCPENLELQCGDEIPGPPEMSATDNCSDFSISYTETIEDLGTCPGEQLITRMWTATDDYDNGSTCTYTITITDETPPTIDSYNGGTPLEDITVSCDEIPDQFAANTSDNCDEDPEIIFTEKIIPGTCEDSYTIYRSYLAVDACGNTSALDEHNITVIDDEAPTLHGYPEDVIVDCDDIPEIAPTLFTEDCPADGGALHFDGTNDYVITPNLKPFMPTTDVTIELWFNADDPGVIVSEIGQPSINTGWHDSQIEILNTGEVKVRVWNLPNVSLGMVNFNEWNHAVVRYNSSTLRLDGLLNGVPSADFITGIRSAPVNQYYAFAAADFTNLGDGTYFGGTLDEIRVWNYARTDQEILDNMNIEISPEMGLVARYALNEGEANENNVGETTAEDSSSNENDGTLQNFALTGSTSNWVEGIGGNFTAFCVTDNCDSDLDIDFEETSTSWFQCQYNIYRTWTATDNCGNSTSHTQTITVEDTYAPVLSSTPGDLTLECDEPVPAPATITATDMCDGTVGVDFDTFTKGDGCELLIVRTWSASDACGNSTSHTQTITIQDTTPPAITHNLDLSIDAECDNIPAAGSISATDNCGGTTTSLSEIIFDGECEDSYTIHRIYIAFDECGNSSSVTQTINVSDNTDPVFDALPQDKFIACLAQGPAAPDNITASDNCDEDVFVYYVDSTPGSCSFTRTWYAQDNCGNTISASQLLSYDDNTAPTLFNLPEDGAVSCDNIPEPASVSATDDCSGAFVAFDQKELPGSCPNNYTILRTWTALDACGNTATHTQVLYVSDDQNPVFNQSLPQSISLSCELPLPQSPTITASDNCGPATVSMSQNQFGDECSGYYTRTWTASDQCGNSVSHTQYIYLFDNQAPDYSYVPTDPQIECTNLYYDEYTGQYICLEYGLADLTAECDNVPAPWSAPVSDNCDTNVSVSYSETSTPGVCPQEYTLTRTWTATDNCGNSTTEVQTINVVDTTAPEFVNTPDDLEILYCDEPWPPIESPTVEDNCDPFPTLTFDQAIEFDVEVATGVNGDVLTRTWTTWDNCGNDDSYTQTIYLIDDCPGNGCVNLYNFHAAPEELTVDYLPNKVRFYWDVPANAVKAQAKITSVLGTTWHLIHNLNFPKNVNNNFFQAGIEYSVEIRFFSQYNPCKITSHWSDPVTVLLQGPPVANLNDGNPFEEVESAKSLSDNLENHLHIYPNPNNGEFFVETNLTDYNIEIFDLSGRIVNAAGVYNTDQSRIEFDSYTPGIYMVRIFNETTTLTERVILK